MHKFLITIALAIIAIALIIIAISLLVKELKERLKTYKILSLTVLVIFLFTSATYLIAIVCRDLRDLNIIEQIGTSDAWIGFAGASLGGVITMLALYFTLQQNSQIMQNQYKASIKPYVFCDIVNLDESRTEILIDNYINDYGFIHCVMKNISNNVANAVKIIDQYSLVEVEPGVEKRYDDLYELIGISIYTVLMNEGTFLSPQGEHRWKTNFSVEQNDDETYKWDGSAFCFKHVIVFQLSDAENMEKYLHKFEYEININVDVDNKLHFFLWNMNNSVTHNDNFDNENLNGGTNGK